MLKLPDWEDALFPEVPGIGIQISDLQIRVEPSDIPLLPTIHIDVKISIRFPW